MSKAAEILLEEKISELIDQLYPEIGIMEFCQLENKMFAKIFSNNFSEIMIQKIDMQAKVLAMMALDLIGGLDVKTIEKEIWDGQRKIQEEKISG